MRPRSRLSRLTTTLLQGKWLLAALAMVLTTGTTWGQNEVKKPVFGTIDATSMLQISEQSNPAGSERALPRMEHSHFEDDGSSIDEIRIGGENRSVTVQPKAHMPAYEIRPTHGARRAHTVDATGSPRVWNLLNF